MEYGSVKDHKTVLEDGLTRVVHEQAGYPMVHKCVTMGYLFGLGREKSMFNELVSSALLATYYSLYVPQHRPDLVSDGACFSFTSSMSFDWITSPGYGLHFLRSYDIDAQTNSGVIIPHRIGLCSRELSGSS